MTEQTLVQAVPQPATVLVVEDDMDIQVLLRDVLAGAGYVVRVADSGEAALALLEREAVDLMLLDLMLPDIDGFEVCRRVREGNSASLPVIMLTALNQPDDVVRGLHGADDYMTKPFFPDELMLRIQRQLRRRHDMLTLADENGTLRDMLQLVQRELQGAQTETQTESLLRHELLHNVSTHLQSLCAIVEAELRKLPPGGERDAVQRIRGRVRGAALVYQVSEVLRQDPVAIGEVIRMTASALKSIYRPWKRILVTVKGEHVELPVSVGASLAMIVNELVTNSFKHAFPDNRFGEIAISYGLDNGEFTLQVMDDGVGINVDAPSKGNGRATVTQLVQSQQGTVTWVGGTTGTRVTLRIPIVASA